MGKILSLACLLPLVFAPEPQEAATGVLCLKDGRILEGMKMQPGEEGVKLIFEHGEILVPNALVLDCLLEGGASTFVPETDEEKKKFEKGLVPFDGRWISPKRRDQLIKKRLKERREQIEDIKKHSRWRDRRTEKTKHFQFEYTVPQHIYEPYRDLMEVYFKEFAKTWRVKQPKDKPKLPICFHVDRGAFEQVGGAGRGVLGYFRFVEPMDLNFYYDRLDPVQTEAVMYHEANHYLQKLINLDFKMPHFPGESIAEYYGASSYDPETKKLTVGLIQEGRLTGIKTEIAAGEMMSLSKMIETDGMYEHYSWGWSLVHFLMNDKRYAKGFQKFVMGLANDKGIKRERNQYGKDNLKTVKGPEILRAFKQYLGLKKESDFRNLEREWHAYVIDKLDLITPSGLEKAATAAANGNPSRPIRAKRLFKEAIEAGSENPLTYHRYAKLLRSDGQTSEAIKLWEKAIDLDPLNATFYRSLGHALKRKGEDEEGERLLKLAQEIDPEDPFLEIDLSELGEDGEDGGDEGGGGGGGEG